MSGLPPIDPRYTCQWTHAKPHIMNIPVQFPCHCNPRPYFDLNCIIWRYDDSFEDNIFKCPTCKKVFGQKQVTVFIDIRLQKEIIRYQIARTELYEEMQRKKREAEAKVEHTQICSDEKQKSKWSKTDLCHLVVIVSSIAFAAIVIAAQSFKLN